MLYIDIFSLASSFISRAFLESIYVVVELRPKNRRHVTSALA
jgi:hypothetical protein